MLIAAANPMTILPYLGVTSALETGNPLIMDRALATPIGVMLGSASWYLFRPQHEHHVSELAESRAGSAQQPRRDRPDGPGRFAMPPHRLMPTAEQADVLSI
jgi:hypothetical protein